MSAPATTTNKKKTKYEKNDNSYTHFVCRLVFSLWLLYLTNCFYIYIECHEHVFQDYNQNYYLNGKNDDYDDEDDDGDDDYDVLRWWRE